MAASKKPLARYAVFGNPIQQSQSPRIHTLFARQFSEAMEYSAQEPALDAFATSAQEFFSNGGRGLNITAPFKQEAFALADELSPFAEAAGAVNTLAIQGKNTIIGHNTDGIGLLVDIRQVLEWGITGQRLLIVGAGGATRGILEPLLAQKPASLFIANRTLANAETLVEKFAAAAQSSGVQFQSCSFTALDDLTFDLVINASSTSLYGELPPLPDALFADGGKAYDLSYAASATPFMQWAKAHGASAVADGLGMLVEQAAEAFFIWRGKRPDTAPVLAVVRETLLAGAD